MNTNLLSRNKDYGIIPQTHYKDFKLGLCFFPLPNQISLGAGETDKTMRERTKPSHLLFRKARVSSCFQSH